MNKLPIAAVLAMWPLMASSAEPLSLTNSQQELDFSLRLGKTESSFQYDDGRTADNTFQWIGLVWREQLAVRLQLGMEGGAASLSQTGNTATAGLEPYGYYAALTLRFVLLETGPVQLYSQAGYGYTRVSQKEDGDTVELSWYQPQLQLGVAFRLVNRLRLFAGAGWSAIDGQERIRGTNRQTTDFEGEHHGTAFAGLDFAVDRDGFVGFELRAGETRGGEVYFKRYF